MSQGLTYEQAAAILGCHFSNMAKLIRKGDLTSMGRRGASLSRSRPWPSVALLSKLPTRPGHRASTSVLTIAPDGEHEWLSPRQVAELLGVTRPAVRARIHRGTLPAVENGGVLGATGSPRTGGSWDYVDQAGGWGRLPASWSSLPHRWQRTKKPAASPSEACG